MMYVFSHEKLNEYCIFIIKLKLNDKYVSTEVMLHCGSILCYCSSSCMHGERICGSFSCGSCFFSRAGSNFLLHFLRCVFSDEKMPFSAVLLHFSDECWMMKQFPRSYWTSLRIQTYFELIYIYKHILNLFTSTFSKIFLNFFLDHSELWSQLFFLCVIPSERFSFGVPS